MNQDANAVRNPIDEPVCSTSPHLEKYQMLNVGCGGYFHRDWVNADLVPAHPDVRKIDLAHGLPFEDGSFDVVYHSHVLEHLPRKAALNLVDECLRVPKRGGIIRIAVPDLEQVTREYIGCLDAALAGVPGAAARHEWIVMELIDQLARDESGGEMMKYWKRENMPAAEYCYERVGWEARTWIQNFRSRQEVITSESETSGPSWRSSWDSYMKSLRKRLACYLLGYKCEYLEQVIRVGKFRTSGESHKWMYDRFSLRQVLEKCGFSDFRTLDAFSSRTPNFSSYSLDVDAEGRVRKPDSLFVEAVKP